MEVKYTRSILMRTDRQGEMDDDDDGDDHSGGPLIFW